MKNKVVNRVTSGVHTVRGVLMLLVFLVVSNMAWAQGPVISVHEKDKPLREVLKAIEKQSDYSFIYSSSTIDVSRIVSVEGDNMSLGSVLDKLAAAAGISYTINGSQVMLSPLDDKSSRTTVNTPVRNGEKVEGKVIKGYVKDEKGEPVAGASVWVKGTTMGVATDIDGNFSIRVSGSNLILVASFIGYSNVEQKITANREVYNFTLSPETQMIEEVIVTGYQTISKERATGSFAIVSPKEMEGKMQTNIVNRMEGMVAGLSNNRGSIEIRGVSTINGTKDPLYVVDGVPFEGSATSGGDMTSPLDVINPSDIVNITVLKDATAASIYGARSANGVIVITTRNGSAGPTRVTYNGSINFQGLPDRGYSNKMSSAELVDFQQMLFKTFPNLSRYDENKFQNDVQLLLMNNKDGIISDADLQQELNIYRNRDRYDQVVNEFLRKKRIVTQHNLSFNGGSDIYKYSLSANYTGTAPYEREQMDHRIGFNLKNSFNFFKWLKVDAGIMGSNTSSDYDNGVAGMGLLNSGIASYYMLRDEMGNPLQMYGTKSQHEIDRLNSMGLMDETYRPVDEMATRHYTAKSRYLNLNLAATFKIIEGLTVDVRYQMENTTGYNKQYDTKNALNVKTMINDAATEKSDGNFKYNIPLGGQIVQTNREDGSYTMRVQANYNRTFRDKHDLQVLLGAERRKVVTSSNGFYRVGYDDDALSFSPIDELTLRQQQSGTESITGYFSFTNKTPKFIYADDRYVSFYGNASYTFENRLTLTGSIRMDQSNLFGTDPKYQYRPLWSAGAHYVLLEDKLGWIDRLVVRATYGINGNVAKKTGPYLIASDGGNNYYTNEPSYNIMSPQNPALRWEKTKVVNVGVDFNLLGNRLNGSVEFYNKSTSDLLGDFSADPTLGWTSLLINFGSLYNRGVEVSLNSQNINQGGFKWNSTFVFGYNKNEITEVQSSDESASSYYNGRSSTGLNIRKGYAMNSLFSVRYAGLDETGTPMAYKKDGTIVKSADLLTKEDLVWSGTYDPPYNASLTNTFSYKGFDLSFMFVYSGGNVMRDVAAGMVLNQHPIYKTTNGDRDLMNYWKGPEDNGRGVNPAFMFQNQAKLKAKDLWSGADKHIQKGDYIKLRDITLGYTLPAEMLKKYMIQGIRVNAQVQNLWWWAANDSKLDPEVWSGSSLAPARGTLYPASVTLGLTLNF